MNPYDRHNERLHTTDENGHRVYVHPDDIGGIWRKRRDYVYTFLLLIFILAPWIKINGEPLILFNLLERKFVFFGNIFWGHDTPLLIFFLLGFIFLFGIITAVYGRLWCGWACPQTIFIDRIFRPIEKMVEGKGSKRLKLDKQRWDFEKVWKRSLKWLLYLLASLLVTHTFISYFVGAYNLKNYILNDPTEHMSAFISMLVLNTIFLFDFAWFREQFCIIMCPYGRIQSVMMDSNSLVVAYHESRGEPRKPGAKKENSFQGDCVNCFQCVRVCPTGIDIRNGMQMECIACTACIDACDSIMKRLKRPTGLISYSTENKLLGIKDNKKSPRLFGYLVILTIVGVVGFFQVKKTNDVRVLFLKSGKQPYKIVRTLDEEKILNHFKIEFFYNGTENKNIYFDLPNNEKGIELVTPSKPFKLKRGRKRITHLFVRFPSKILIEGTRKVSIRVYENKNQKNEIASKEIFLVGPYESSYTN